MVQFSFDSSKQTILPDWVKWFNEANGAPYDITPYSLIKCNRENS